MLQLLLNDGRKFPLDKERLRVGRDKGNDIILDEPEISGFHAEIASVENRWFITDLSSKNGTLLNGKKVTRAEIKAWDAVAFSTIGGEITDTEGRRPTQAINIAGTATPDATQVREAAAFFLRDVNDASSAHSLSPGSRVTVGRDPSNAIRIDAKTVSGRHAELFFEEGNLLVQDLQSTNGTFVNGEKVSRRILKQGDLVAFDVFKYKVEGFGKAPTGVAPQGTDKTETRPAAAPGVGVGTAAELVLVSVSDGKRYEIGPQGALIGRDKGCDISIDDLTVSSKHAEISKENGRWHIKDLESTNGTFVGDKPIDKKSPVEAGKKIRLGNRAFVLEGPSQEPQAGAPRTQPSQTAAARTEPSTGERKSRMPLLIGVSVAILVLIGLAVFMMMRGGMGDPKKLQANALWTIKFDGQILSTPALGDINGDSVNDVVFASTAGAVRGLDGITGKLIFEVQVPGQVLASVALVDTNKDRKAEILIATTAGEVHVIDDQGRFVWKSPENIKMGSIQSSPVTVDLNRDGTPDVVVGTESMGIVALDGTRGWLLWNSPKKFTQPIIATPLISDINADGTADVVAVDYNGNVAAISGTNGWILWHEKLEGTFMSSPVSVKLGTEDKGIVLLSEDGTATMMRQTNGAIGWIYKAQKKTKSSPVAFDINQDGTEDIFYAAGSPAVIHAVDGKTGKLLWSNVQIPAPIESSPMVLPTKTGRSAFLLFTAADGSLLALDAATGWTVYQEKLYPNTAFFASPVGGDIAHHKYLDIVVASQAGDVGLYATNLPAAENQLVWPRFLNR